MQQLEDSQIWESRRCLIQIQAMGKCVFDFRGVIFEKNRSGVLKFNNVIYNERNRLIKFMANLGMVLVKKKIITREKN